MKKNFLIVFAVILIAMSFFACDIFTTSKIGKDTKPKPKTVTVDYARVLPVPNPNGMDAPGLNWSYDPYQGGVIIMTKAAEDNFTASGVSIMTETRITIFVIDGRMYNGSTAKVCKTLKIDGQELEIGSTYGQATFIYDNDGKVRKPGT